MKRRPPPPPVDLGAWAARPAFERNRLVSEWLGDDIARAKLYEQIRAQPHGVLAVPSRARHDDDDVIPPGGAELSRAVYLVADPDLVRSGLTDGKAFGNLPYRRLGSGEFMLGLDPVPAGSADATKHQAQADALHGAFRKISGPDLCALAAWSSRAAVISLGTREFDAATLAEHAAARCAQQLYGFTRADLIPLIEDLGKAYRAMTVQMLGRHFVTEPGAVPAGRAAMARLAQRADALMQDYARGDPDWPQGLDDAGDDMPAITPVLKSLALDAGGLDGAERAVLAIGSLAGTVGNIQAATCIAMAHLMAHPDQLWRARVQAHLALKGNAEAQLWAHFIAPALRANPAAPYLPRRMKVSFQGLPAGEDCLLCVGSATIVADAPPANPALADALVFGLDVAQPAKGLHWCLGAHLARTLVSHIVAELLRLPGLEERLDDTDARPIGLRKRWGFACESYPMQHRLDRRVRQQPLNVMMRVRQPVDDHGAALRRIILSGGPAIERLLRQARHVHFAWFEFLENGHVLALHTVFDGDFEAYLQHFALKAGDLFDALFEHVEQGPKAPVTDHPEAFVRAILAAHHGPAEGFFFSAYPQGDTPTVQRALGRLP